MYYYEIVYIVHPALQAGHLDDTINKINDKINHLKGKVLFFENWGKKKLSYLIQKQKFGTYIIMQCELNGKDISDLNNDFEHNANIIRHLVTKIDKEDIMEQRKELEDQKASRPSDVKEQNTKEETDSKEETDAKEETDSKEETDAKEETNSKEETDAKEETDENKEN